MQEPDRLQVAGRNRRSTVSRHLRQPRALNRCCCSVATVRTRPSPALRGPHTVAVTALVNSRTQRSMRAYVCSNTASGCLTGSRIRRVSIGCGSRSPKTNTSRSVRPKRTQISWRWVRSMTTMRSAARTLSAVTRWDRCTERSTPWRAAAATASGGGCLPGGVKPAESTRTRCRESARSSNAAANGLRQLLPRQITSRDVTRGRERSALRARCRYSRWKTRRGTPRSCVRSSVTTHARPDGLRVDSHETLRRAPSHRTKASNASSIHVS